jgi:hypothetical protein
MWIRASTGKICLELTPGYQVLSRPYFIECHVYQHEKMFDDSVKLRVADIITSTSFLQYYSAFCEDQPTATLLELPASASLGSILDLGPSGTCPGTVIASIPVRPAQSWRYQHRHYETEGGGELESVLFTCYVIFSMLIRLHSWTWDEILSYSVVDDQWARYVTIQILSDEMNDPHSINSGSVAEMYYYNGDLEPEGLRSWLAQANHIFNQSNISDSLERFGESLEIISSAYIQHIQ